MRSTNFKPFIGTGYVVSGSKGYPGDGKASVTFRFQAQKSGEYHLLMAYYAHETRARNVPVTVRCGTRESAFIVDQPLPLPVGHPFQPIGGMMLEANVESTVQIRNAGTTGFIILDAVQLYPIE